jgi:hypothetical protein
MQTTGIQCKTVSGAMGDFGGAQPDKYAGCTPLQFRQGWVGPLAAPQEGGVAYVGRALEGLCFYTCLQDSDIFSRATADDQKMWTLGDVVEFFVKPGRERSDYWEIHLTPNGHIMDLYIEERGAFLQGGAAAFARALSHRSQSKFEVTTFPDQRKWAAQICIPWKAFGAQGAPPAASTWQFAVCRYNCSGGLENPELSSVAPFTIKSFHRYEEFLDLVF